jgi:hypothetical protein
MNFFEKQFYPKFAEKFVGSDYRTQLGDDTMIGAEHYDSYREKVKETPTSKQIIGYKCTGRNPESNLPIIVSSGYLDEAARNEAGAVASQAEAALQCPDEVIPGKVKTTGTTPDKPGFLTPDKLSLLAAGLIPPQAYVPSVAELPFRQGDLALEDWLSKAQQRQQGFNIAANTLGQYQPGTALASNLSFLAGQTGEGVSQDIAQVDSRNVDRANQFMAQELQRKGANDMYNASARDRRFEGLAVTKQNLDNARRKYISGITKATNNAFANRMYLDMLNKVNPIYNVDPRSGLSFYKEGYDTSKFGPSSQGSMPSMQNFSALKNQFMGYGMSENRAESEALGQIRGGRTTYTDSEADGVPNSVRTTVPGSAMNLPANYIGALNFRPSGMYGGQIGPWTKKKK